MSDATVCSALGIGANPVNICYLCLNIYCIESVLKADKTAD